MSRIKDIICIGKVQKKNERLATAAAAIRKKHLHVTPIKITLPSSSRVVKQASTTTTGKIQITAPSPSKK